jgi:hypothetical protein
MKFVLFNLSHAYILYIKMCQVIGNNECINNT